MKVAFWGTRGSLSRALTAEDVQKKISRAVAMAEGRRFEDAAAIDHFVATELPFATKASYGGNTSCVEIENGEEYVVCDAGTGLRDFGNHVLKMDGKKAQSFHIFLSHLHWDHLQGFPFFVPAYMPQNRITFYGAHKEMEKALTFQQSSPFFPVPFDYLAADIRFQLLQPGEEYDVAGLRVAVIEQDHPGSSFGYGFSRAGKKIVYSTDSEHKQENGNADVGFKTLIDGADLLIFDAQYAFLEADDMKRNWGHSSNILGVEFAVERKVKHLVLFHTEPTFDDETLDKLLNDTRKYARYYADDYELQVTMAYDGLRIEV